MTACWSKSKTGDKHPYYMCKKKGCVSYRKSIRRTDLERYFETLLKGMQPSQGLFETARKMFLKLWDTRLAKAEEHAQTYGRKSAAVQKQIDTLLNRIVESENSSVISAYETRIAKLGREKLVLEEKASTTSAPRYAQEELFELAFKFLSNPYDIYKKGSLSVKRTALRLAFREPVSYAEIRVFET